MKKIIDFCKERYKVLIPIMVVFVLLIAIFFVYREYRYDNYRDKSDVKVYQYFAGRKTAYTATITRNLKKIIIEVEAKGEEIEYDATPIYYQDDDMVLFPSDMTIVFPLKGGTLYRLNKYTLYGVEDETHKLMYGTNSSDEGHFFLSDGSGLYFFSDKVDLKINDEDYLTLSKGSYVQVIGGYTLVYYDRENDKSKVIDIASKSVKVENDNVKIDLLDHAFYVFGKRSLINLPYTLNPLLSNWQIKVLNDIIKFRIGVL